MPSILPKKFPAPVLSAFGPFFAAGVIVLYGINAAQNTMMNTAEFRNDPRNPNINKKTAVEH